MSHTPGLEVAVGRGESLQNWEEEASTLPSGTPKSPCCDPADPATDCDQRKPDTRDAVGGVWFLRLTRVQPEMGILLRKMCTTALRWTETESPAFNYLCA